MKQVGMATWLEQWSQNRVSVVNVSRRNSMSACGSLWQRRELAEWSKVVCRIMRQKSQYRWLWKERQTHISKNYWQQCKHGRCYPHQQKEYGEWSATLLGSVTWNTHQYHSELRFYQSVFKLGASSTNERITRNEWHVLSCLQWHSVKNFSSALLQHIQHVITTIPWR